MPNHDPFATVLHGAAGHAVSHVLIDGATVLEDGLHTTIDMDDLTARVSAWQREHA